MEGADRRPAAVLSVLATLVPLAGIVAGCGVPPDADAAPDTAAEQVAGQEWVVLFDGTSLDAWRAYHSDGIPHAWRIEDGTLHYAPGSRGGDLVSRASFGDFELVLEWKVGPCGNSGLFYRGALGDSSIWRNAPEMQLLDDACHPDARFPSHRAGSNYDLYMATPGVVRAGGEWNQARIVARGARVEHWLNGEKVVEYEQGTPAWEARVAASKFRQWPQYGLALEGRIGLQDHGDPVWFRDIRVRALR